MLSLSSSAKSIGACIIFSLSGLFSCLFLVSDWKLALPNLIFYIVLLVNTYFSILTFGPMVHKKNLFQNTVDAVLVLMYLFLSFSIGNYYWFSIWGILLFMAPILKYLNLGLINDFSKLLKKKIFIDSLGLVAFLLTFGGTLLGFGFISMWIWAIVFIMANIYIFSVNPLYNFSAH